MTFQQFLIILYARRKLALYIFGIVVGTTLVVSLLLPKEYTATTSVVVDVKSPDPIAGLVLPGLVSPGYMATQIDVIQSERVATRVVRMLGFDKSQDAVEKWRDDTGGEGSFDVYFANSLQKRLVVKPSRESNVITISFSATDPKFAAVLTNAFARAYIDTTIDLRVEPARQYAAWFDERLKGLRANLEAAQTKLSAYQQEKGIVVSDERLDAENGRLNDLTGQLAAAQGQRVEATSRQKSGTSESSPDVMQNPLVQGLKSDLARAEAKLAEVGKTLGKNHPQYLQLEGQANGLREQIKQEVGRISVGAASANRFGITKESELRAAIEEQKKRLFELRAQRDALGSLLKDVENAQRAYESVAQRQSQTTLESQSQQTNVLVLSPASVPIEASKPRIFLNLLISMFVGGMLALGVAIAFELLDRRVRNPSDLVTIDEDIPMLGSLGIEPPPLSLKRMLSWVARLFARRKKRGPLNTPALGST